MCGLHKPEFSPIYLCPSCSCLSFLSFSLLLPFSAQVVEERDKHVLCESSNPGPSALPLGRAPGLVSLDHSRVRIFDGRATPAFGLRGDCEAPCQRPIAILGAEPTNCYSVFSRTEETEAHTSLHLRRIRQPRDLCLSRWMQAWQVLGLGLGLVLGLDLLWLVDIYWMSKSSSSPGAARLRLSSLK